MPWHQPKLKLTKVHSFLSASSNKNLNAVFTNGRWSPIDRDQTWFVANQQGTKLTGSGAAGNAEQGYSIALSADGNTMAVGGPDDDYVTSVGYVGAVWIFTRSGTVWSQQGSKLIGAIAADNYGSQGSSVALSADGNTMAEGAPRYGTESNGGIWVFTRSGTVWSQQGNQLGGAPQLGFISQGASIALSADGNTMAEGGPGYDNGVGAVWIFTRSNGVWTQQGDQLIGSDAIGNASQGNSVALSADGNTIAEAGNGDDGGVGAVWIFTRSNGVWSQQGSKLTGLGASGTALQGNSVALSANGNTLVEGGPYDNGGFGAVWVFTRCGTGLDSAR